MAQWPQQQKEQVRETRCTLMRRFASSLARRLYNCFYPTNSIWHCKEGDKKWHKMAKNEVMVF